MAKPITLICADGTRLSATVFSAESPRATLIIGSALGVSHGFYQRFAQFVSAQGFNVISFDYRMTGENADVVQEARLRDWGQQDINAAISYALNLALPVCFIGHSIGGQLLGLAPLSPKLKKIVLVAASAPYWRRWPFPGNIKMLFTGRVVFPLVAGFSQEFPSRRFGLGNLNIPSPIFKEWCHCMACEEYLFADSLDFDTSAYNAIAGEVLSLGFSDDSLAPESNLAYLLRFFPNANTELRMLTPADYQQAAIGHTGVFRDKFRDTVWTQLVDDLNKAL